MAYDDPTHFKKKLVLHTSDGDVTLDQNAARSVQKYMEDQPRFFKIMDTAKKETYYYDMGSASCGFCKVATLTSSKEEGEPLECEDPVPNCPEDGKGD